MRFRRHPHSPDVPTTSVGANDEGRPEAPRGNPTQQTSCLSDFYAGDSWLSLPMGGARFLGGGIFQPSKDSLRRHGARDRAFAYLH